MAKVISTLFISADGVAEIDPDWHFPYFDDNMGRAVDEDYRAADVLLIGRVTYDSFAGAWPEREAAGGEDAPFAKALGDRRKIVISHQDLEFTWRNSELLHGDLADAVTALKAEPGIEGIVIPGSISVVQQLLAAGLVDELRLLVHPVAARKGRHLFDDGDTPTTSSWSSPRPTRPVSSASSTPPPPHPARSPTTTSPTTYPTATNRQSPSRRRGTDLG